VTRTGFPDLPRVRLSKDGKWAICASVPCGERFAARIELGELRGAVLDFLPGWHEFSGEWLMSKRARERVSQGRQPAYRREPLRESADRNRQRDRSHRPAGFTQNAREYPVTVICPACGLRQEADTDALRLS
jgi:hypothetical protein